MSKITLPALQIIIGVIISLTTARAQQSSLKVMAEVPVQFGLGYEGKISKHFSVALSAGILTPPNSTLILNVLEKLGTDEQIILMIDDAFKLGIVGEAGINYNFRHNYVGAFFQVIALHGGDAPTALVEDYFNTSINNYPVKKGRSPASEKYLHLTSALYQAGVLYGHRFPLKNKRFEIDTELGFSANVGSTSKLTSDVRTLSALSAEVDKELAGYYSEYAFVPSLTVALVYKLNKPL